MPEDPARYLYDVFVSYARANDHERWVTRFKEWLTGFLKERLDRNVRVFWDEQSLKRNEELDTAILQAVRTSRVMVIIVSHKYLTRPWCSLEREAFLQSGDPSCIMIVRYDDVPTDTPTRSNDAFAKRTSRWLGRVCRGTLGGEKWRRPPGRWAYADGTWGAAS